MQEVVTYIDPTDVPMLTFSTVVASESLLS